MTSPSFRSWPLAVFNRRLHETRKISAALRGKCGSASQGTHHEYIRSGRTNKAVVLIGRGLNRYEWREDWPVLRLIAVLIAVGVCWLNNIAVNTRVGWYAQTVSAQR